MWQQNFFPMQISQWLYFFLQIYHTGQQKTAWFESDFCVTIDNIPFFFLTV